MQVVCPPSRPSAQGAASHGRMGEIQSGGSGYSQRSSCGARMEEGAAGISRAGQSRSRTRRGGAAARATNAFPWHGHGKVARRVPCHLSHPSPTYPTSPLLGSRSQRGSPVLRMDAGDWMSCAQGSVRGRRLPHLVPDIGDVAGAGRHTEGIGGREERVADPEGGGHCSAASNTGS